MSVVWSDLGDNTVLAEVLRGIQELERRRKYAPYTEEIEKAGDLIFEIIQECCKEEE